MKHERPTSEGHKAEAALRKAVRKAIEENRKLGFPVAVMRNGEAALIPAEEAVSQVREERSTYRTRSTRK